MLVADVPRLLRMLPAVDDVLREPGPLALLDAWPRWAVVAAVRAALDERRSAIRDGRLTDAQAAGAPIAAEDLAERAARLTRPSLRRALNATGVVLHTNLGRAPLSERAIERLWEVARGYSTLEFDPARRERGDRHQHVSSLLCALTGAESALVVNNNAGGVLLALAALGAGREVVVSRGELIEIGGAFRVPDVMRASGAILREVGTTNKTRLDDYQAAVGADTALLLKVHRSNFAIVGFTEEVELTELVAEGRARNLPVMIDLGSGALVDARTLGLPVEPTVGQAVAAGADVVTFSGDKLLGGPQAGLLVGRAEVLAVIARHPLMRALRPDKLTLAALEATLEAYRDGVAVDEIPTLRALGAPLPIIERRAVALLSGLRGLPGLVASLRHGRSAVGGGVLPLAEPDTWAVGLRHEGLDTDGLADRLAAGEPPLVGRISDGELVLDARTLADDDVGEVIAAVSRALGLEPADAPGREPGGSDDGGPGDEGGRAADEQEATTAPAEAVSPPDFAGPGSDAQTSPAPPGAAGGGSDGPVLPSSAEASST